MESAGAQMRKYSSRESQFISESFEFLGSEEDAEKEADSNDVSNHGSGDIKDEHSEELSSSGNQKEIRRGGNVKDLLRRRASSHATSENNSQSDVNKKHSRESVFINDAFGFLQEDTTEEGSVSNGIESPESPDAPTSAQRQPLRKYSSRESQFVSETFDFLTLDEEEETEGTSQAAQTAKSDNKPRTYSSRESQFVSETFDFLPLEEEEEEGTSPAVAPSKGDNHSRKKYSSRESQFVSETFEFLSSGEDEVEGPSGKPVMRKDSQPHSSRDSVTVVNSDKTEGVSDADSLPTGGTTNDKDSAAEPCVGCTANGVDRASLLRKRSHKGRSRCVESMNSSDDDMANRTESAIVKLALKRVGEFTDDKFLVEYESEGSEATEEENCEEYDSGLQESYTAEDASSVRTSSEVSDDKGVGDDGSVRTSSDISDGGPNSTPVTADMKAVKKTKRTDSTSTTASEAEFQQYGMQGSLRKRLVHRQSSVVTYECKDENTEVDKVVEVVKMEGEAGYGFHLSGGAPVVISTVEPGSCAARVGLSVGDALITINSRNIATASVDEVIVIIRQNPDKVTLGVRQESLPFDRTLCCGYMMKQGGKGVFKNWKKRWFDLKADHCLYYYKTDQDKEPVGAIVLSGYTVARAPEINREHTFKLYKYGQRSYYFQADSSRDMNRWAGVLANMATTTAKKDTWLDVSAHNVGLSALSIKDPECHGFLTKLGGRVKNWKRRYCVLKDACLYYFIDVNSHTAQGIVHLHGYYVLETSQQGKKFGFTLLAPETTLRTFHFFAENQTDYARWVNALKSSIGKWVKTGDAD